MKKVLLAAGADLEASTMDNWTSLMSAAANGHSHTVKVVGENQWKEMFWCEFVLSLFDLVLVVPEKFLCFCKRCYWLLGLTWRRPVMLGHHWGSLSKVDSCRLWRWANGFHSILNRILAMLSNQFLCCTSCSVVPVCDHLLCSGKQDSIALLNWCGGTNQVWSDIINIHCQGWKFTSSRDTLTG